MRVEVINTGTELLLGNVINTHLKFIAEALFPLGMRIAQQLTVPDGPAIRDAVADTFGRADLVLITGGLGPTTDDITRELIAELLGLELVHDESIMTAIAARFAARGLTLNPRVARQAQRPREATVLANQHGTAPGLYLPPLSRVNGRHTHEAAAAARDRPSVLDTPHLFLLPGPPRELKPMFTESVLPILARSFPPQAEVEMRSFRFASLGESAVEERVGEQLLALGVELGYCARPGEVDLRLIGAPLLLDRAEPIVREKLGPHIVSDDARSLEKVVVDLLTARGETLAIAESCTGGAIAHRITNVAGSSAVFVEGFVTYANEAKTRSLGVSPELIRTHGAVSSEVVTAMAYGAQRVADHALATTGIAGPGGGSAEKPVGTVFIGLASKGRELQVERHRFPTDRENFKHLVTQAALDLLRRSLR